MQALSDLKENLLLSSGIITSLVVWPEVARIHKVLSGISEAIFDCCPDDWSTFYGNTCNLGIVKVFGSGLSISSTSHCKQNYESLSSSYTLQHTVNVLSGIIGTATAISMLVTLGKRAYCECCSSNEQSTENRQKSMYEIAKNIGLFVNASSLVTNLAVNFGAYSSQLAKINIAINACCGYTSCCGYEPYSSCVGALGSTLGPGFNVSNFVDLCGGGLYIAQQINTSSMITTSLMIAAVTAVPLAFLIKNCYDNCLCSENVCSEADKEGIENSEEVDLSDTYS